MTRGELTPIPEQPESKMHLSQEHLESSCKKKKLHPGLTPFHFSCPRPSRRRYPQTDCLGATLLQCIDFMCYRHLPPPQHRSHYHHHSCHSSKAKSPGGCSKHSCSCRGNKALVKRENSPLTQPDCAPYLLRLSTAAPCLSSFWRKITGPLLETWEAPSWMLWSALLLPPVE